MSENEAVIKIIAKHTKEFNELYTDYKKLGVDLLFWRKEYAKLLDEKTNVDALCTTLRHRNKDLRVIVVRFERENKSLQQSLEDCQGELERAFDKLAGLEGEGG